MESKIELIPILNLAYIGDSVFEIMVRRHLLDLPSCPVDKLSKMGHSISNARYQSKCYFKIKDILNNEEISILKRGRNANPSSRAKNSSIGEYRNATGLEALFGFLYLKNENNRIQEIFKLCIEEIENLQKK